MAEASENGKTRQLYTIQFKKDILSCAVNIVIELLLQNLILNQNV